MEHHSCDSKTRVGVLFWEEALYSDIWNIINKELKPIRDSEHSHIYLLEHLLDISEDLDSLKQKIVKNICNDVENGCSIFVLMGDIIVDALGACLVNDTSFDSLIRTREVILIATIATCPEVIHPNLIRWWAPSANLIARYIAQYMLRIGIRQAACEEFYPINMQWSKDEGTPGGVFKTFFELGGGKINSESENVYVAGFGASYDEFYEKTMLRDSDKRFFTDHGIIGKLLKNDNARFSIPANVGYCDFIPKNSNERGETNYAIFVREIFSCIKRIRKWAKDISFLECLKSGRYLEFSLKDDCLLSDIGQILVPISFYRGDSKEIELLSDVGDISQEKIAYSLRIADQLAAELQINQLTSSPQNVWWEIGFRTFYRKALQNFGIYSCSTVVVHNNAKVERRFCSDTCQGTMHNVSEAVITLLLKNDGCIQLNIGIDDYEDNDAHRVYVVESGKIIPWGCVTQSPHKENIIRRISSIVIAKTRQSAELLYSHAKSQSKDSFIKSLNVEGASVIVGDTARTVVSELCSLPIDSKYYYLLIEHLGGYRSNSPLFGYVILTASNKLGYLALQAIRTIISRMLLGILSVESLRDMKVSQIKSAIGSIMSRNGSHNIGSHVLAALSHNVGTMPDDQVLYQYIQHRMDYIATATTDRPTWTQPTMFVGDMMRRFLSQRHLLNYICRSEGLKAFEFQSDRARINDKGGRIKLHIRKVDAEIDDNGVYNFKNVKQDFINYSRDKIDNKIDLKEDVSLAIPGGVVGQHAFFTIIENIIRNAAKHDWSTPPKATAVLKDAPIESDQEGLRTGDLDVYIDYIDKPENENVQFVVWTRLSDVEDGKDDRNDKTLDVTQQKKLEESFISDGGVLRRENWGLAEMKISAGYLQKAKIEDIGGISENKGSDIIKPCKISEEWSCDKNQLKSGGDKGLVQHLGYVFDVPKAQSVLFVVKDVPREIATKESELKKYGIWIKIPDAIICSQGSEKNTIGRSLNYAYVVIDQGVQLNDACVLPARVIRTSVNVIFEKCKGEDAETMANKLIQSACSIWAEKLLDKKGYNSLSLNISVVDSSSDENSGKSLANDIDIVEYAFNEGLFGGDEHGRGALDIYRSDGKYSDEIEIFINCLDDLHKAKKLTFDRRRELELLRGGDAIKVDFDMKSVVKRQLCQWLESWNNDNNDADVASAINWLRPADLEKIDSEIKSAEAELISCSKGTEQYKKWSLILQGLYTKRDNAGSESESPISHLVDYLVNYSKQIRSLISKYAEKIATLPLGFSSKSNVVTAWNDNWKVGDKIINIVKDCEISTTGSSFDVIAKYKRHATKKDNELYLEGLSGTQSYLTTLEHLSNTGSGDNYLLRTRLVENALLRIFIVDERVRDFLQKHPDLVEKFRNMGIDVGNDEKLEQELKVSDEAGEPKEIANLRDPNFVDLSIVAVYNARTEYKAAQNKEYARAAAVASAQDRYSKYDAIIIHQGIIDKWLPGASHDKSKVENFLESLQKIFKNVIITTGRGTPANIPDSGKVLPFSTIQTTLFKQYPEKLILTDAIMNILPIKAGGNHGQ